MNTEEFDGTPNDEISDAVEESNSNTQITISKSLMVKTGIGVLIVALGIGGFFILNSTKTDKRFSDALVACDAVDASGIVLAEDSQSLTFDGKGDEDFFGGDYSDLVCIIDELKGPSTIEERMSRTNSLMGVQDADWDGIAISWSYHPNNGLDANLEIQK
ncbi:hypothetical protein MCEMRE191_00486 [Candidatus Nanopelagicaceae bacterium]